MSTLAHEAGHLMHSYFSSKTQPYPTAGYPTFVAEVASTFNEALLIEQMLKKVQEPKARLALLGNYLEGVKGTVFRQTQFAEFELRIHEMAQKGEPLTGDALSKSISRSPASTTATIRRSPSSTTTSRTSGPTSPTSTGRSMCSSTRRRSRRRRRLSEKVLSGSPDAVKRYRTFPGLGRVEVCGRPAEGRRRGHDDQRAARSDHPEDEPRDGRDGEAAEELTIADCRLQIENYADSGRHRASSLCSRSLLVVLRRPLPRDSRRRRRPSGSPIPRMPQRSRRPNGRSSPWCRVRPSRCG